MGQISQSGALNLTGLIVPDLYVDIISPQVSSLNGVSTNILGIVGTAQWGPVGAPVSFGTAAEFAAAFGAIQNRKYDLGTAVAIAIQQGASSFFGVRVTDGTDVAATCEVKDGASTPAIGMTLTAIYSGTLGNSLAATVSAGSKSGTSRLVLSLAGSVPEIYDNIAGSGDALWAAMVAAVNSGNSALRGKSALATAAVGTSSAAPALDTTTFSGGTDGADTITGSVLVGVDGAAGARTGMYALTGTGCNVALLADCDDSTTWSTQEAYGLAQGTFMYGTGPAGQTPTTAAAAKSSAGIDSYAFKLLLGDWVYWLDSVNGVTRLVSPQAFAAGLRVNLAPQNSSLNEQVYGVVGTQTSLQSLTYATSDLTILANAGIDVICNPIPQGSMFGVRIGHNTSSDNTVYGENYTTMTNYLAKTLNAGMGKFVGYIQSISPKDPTRRAVAATISSFLQAMVDADQLDSFSVVCDLSNNTVSRIGLGYLQCDVVARYLGIVEKLIVTMQGGQTVTVTTSSLSAT